MISPRWFFIGLLFFIGTLTGAEETTTEVLQLEPMRIGPGHFRVSLQTDPTSGKIVEAEVSWVRRSVKELQRGDRLMFIDGEAVTAMTPAEFGEASRRHLAPGESSHLLFKGERGKPLKREVTIHLELIAPGALPEK